MLHSLLLSSDRDTVRVVTRVFKDLEVDIDHCEETFSALSQAIEHHYDAIIIDDSMEEPHVALQKLIETSLVQYFSPNCFGRSFDLIAPGVSRQYSSGAFTSRSRLIEYDTDCGQCAT